jgi:hypothetical protein
MKRIGDIYQKIYSIENIKLAIMNASKGKRNRRVVKNIIENIDKASAEIQKMLIDKSYQPKPYREFIIKTSTCGKERKICCPAFYPDQIIHWALIQVIQPIIMKGMYEFNCGSIPGKGVHYGKRYIERWLERDRKHTKHCLKLDIKKYYQSIDTNILKTMFSNKIKDKNVLWLIGTIIDSHADGLPIGNYTSQWWANFFLEKLDHYIKETLHIKYYLRYVDDMVLFGNSKKELHRARKLISEYLSNIHLTLKGNWQVFRVDSRPIDFLGFKFYRDHTELRGRNALRIRRRVKKAYKKGKVTIADAKSILSYMGWITHSNSHNFYIKNVMPYADIKKLKEMVSRESREQHRASRALRSDDYRWGC